MYQYLHFWSRQIYCQGKFESHSSLISYFISIALENWHCYKQIEELNPILQLKARQLAQSSDMRGETEQWDHIVRCMMRYEMQYTSLNETAESRDDM